MSSFQCLHKSPAMALTQLFFLCRNMVRICDGATQHFYFLTLSSHVAGYVAESRLARFLCSVSHQWFTAPFLSRIVLTKLLPSPSQLRVKAPCRVQESRGQAMIVSGRRKVMCRTMVVMHSEYRDVSAVSSRDFAAAVAPNGLSLRWRLTCRCHHSNHRPIDCHPGSCQSQLIACPQIDRK